MCVCVKGYTHTHIYPEDMFTDFREREKEREMWRERQRETQTETEAEKHRSIVCHARPDQGSNPRPFWVTLKPSELPGQGPWLGLYF